MIEISSRSTHAAVPGQPSVRAGYYGSGFSVMPNWDFITVIRLGIAKLRRKRLPIGDSEENDHDLLKLVEDALAPYRSYFSIFLDGSSIILHPKTAQSLSLVLHELTANAVEHGALSKAGGRLLVHWHAEQSQDNTIRLIMVWREQNGPRVSKPTRTGFGTSIIRDMLRYEFDADVTLLYDADGLKCRITMPLTEILA